MKMAFKLTKAQLTERDRVMDLLTDATEGIESAAETYNKVLAEAKAPFEAAIVAYNDALSAIRELAEEIYGEADSEISDKSDKWQDSEKGQAAIAFKDHWEGLQLDEVSVDFPDEIEIDLPFSVDDLGEAPEGAES
jgi:vacuolar-type H+-ATPase subunit H